MLATYGSDKLWRPVQRRECAWHEHPAAQLRSRKRARLCVKHVVAAAQKEAPDWDAERLVLRKRTLKPNQLETLRKFEEEVAVGTVRCPSYLIKLAS